MAKERERLVVAEVSATTGRAALAHDPDAYTQAFARRPRSELPSDPDVVPPGLPVMLDTNFYILRLQNKLPAEILAFVEGRTILHCAVALAELSISAGILDPGHSETERNRGPVLRLLESISLSDCRSPRLTRKCGARTISMTWSASLTGT